MNNPWVGALVVQCLCSTWQESLEDVSPGGVTVFQFSSPDLEQNSNATALQLGNLLKMGRKVGITMKYR